MAVWYVRIYKNSILSPFHYFGTDFEHNMTERAFFLSLAFICIAFPILVNCGGTPPQAPIPTIIDTDIGSYIDDSYAIAFALQSMEYLDVKLIMTCTDDTEMRAKITAKFLTVAGQDHIPIGIGAPNNNITNHTLWEWAQDYNLSNYKGGVYKFEDALTKMTELINNSPSVVDIIALGPLNNFPYLLNKYPDIVNKTRLKVMGGSIYRGYDNSTTPCVEYNVKLCPHCLDLVLHTNWVEPVTLTPLDTGGVAYLTPENVQKLIDASSIWSNVLEQHTLYWCTKGVIPCHLEIHTIALPDPVAVLLALPNVDNFIDFKDLRLIVTEDGYVKVNNTNGASTKVALNWKENLVGLSEYRTYLTSILSKS